jgi:hypothetical protein
MGIPASSSCDGSTLLDREHVDEYLDVLLQKVEEVHYPSKQLLDRIARWTLSAS